MIGLVAELLLQSRELRQRLLELAVLERDCGVVGKGLEQAQIVVAERGALGQAIADQEGSDDPGLAAEGGDHRLAQSGPVGFEG